MLVGLVGTGAHYTVDRGPELPAAVAVALLSVLYGYAIKFATLIAPLGTRVADLQKRPLQRIVQPL